MLENIWFIAAVWMGLALIASLISIRTGISVALVEILVGVVAGNLARWAGRRDAARRHRRGGRERGTAASRAPID